MSTNKNISEESITTTKEGGGVQKQQITRPKRFLVHFRRTIAPDYDGSYGFDWLRDEYIYDKTDVVEEGLATKRLYNGANIGNLFKEYTRLKRSDATDLPEVAEIVPLKKETYIPAWLAIFPTSNSIHANGVDLHLQIDQESPDGLKPEELENDGTILTFETSAGVVVSPLEISLGKLITQKRDYRELISSVVGLSSKTIYYYKDESVKINIKANESYSEAGYIKVIATRKGKTRNVGLLIMYPNNVVPKAEVQIVKFSVTPYNKNNPFASNVFIPFGYEDAIETKSFNQALVKANVVSSKDNIELKLPDELKNYQSDEDKPIRESIESFLNNYQNKNIPNNEQTKIELTDSTISLFELLHPKKVSEDSYVHSGWIDDNNNKKTYVIFTDLKVNDGQSATYGRATIRRATEKEINICEMHGGASCNSVWGNAVLLFSITGDDKHSIVHEIGHSFGLSHTFIPYGQTPSTEHTFYRGYTDNIMDYSLKANPKVIIGANLNNPFKGHTHALFKWQWDMLRSDRSMDYSDS